MKQANQDIRFRKIERSTLLFLILLILLSYCYNFMNETKLETESSYLSIDDIIHKKEDVDTLKKVIRDFKNRAKNSKKKMPPKSVHYVNFDPNKTDSLTWLQLGLRSYTISNILKYRRKGGQFYNCSDLKKIYSLDDQTYVNILPYCSIEIKKKTYEKRKRSEYTLTTSTKPKYNKPKPRPIIDINTADTSQLKTLYGIGPVLASRIVSYRSRLGGFHSLDQLIEVYALDSIVLEDNHKRLTLSGNIRRLDLNVVLDSLVKHPYIDWSLGRVIVNYRKQHGDYNQPEDLLKTKRVSDSLYRKLLPYLKD